jgi:hypothetical protein
MFRLKTAIGFFGLIILTSQLPAQLGGNSTYAFLNLTNSARVASLGGKVVSLWDDDLNLPFHNPALLHEGMSNSLVMNYVNYFSDINYGYVSYARSYDNVGNFALGLHYINYGKFIAADNVGNITGEFKAAEYAFNMFYSRAIDDNFSIGVNLKPI